MSFKHNFGIFKVKLQWLLDSADLISRSEHAGRLKMRLLTVNTEFLKFEEAFQHIIELADPDVTAQAEILTACRLEYTRGLEAFDRLMEANLQAKDDMDRSDCRSDAGRSESDGLLSRLPTLQLPSFAGAMDEWVGFINLFDSLVDARSDLSGAQKLAYLMSCLSGEARGLVQHLRISDEGYQISRELLIKRYQNTRRLADVHVDQILSLPSVSPKLLGLRAQFLNPVIMAVNSLERLGFPIKEWSFLLLHICLAKLPINLKTRFEQKCGSEAETIPTFSEFLEFLEAECRLLESAGTVSVHRVQEPVAGPSRTRRGSPQLAALTLIQPCGFCGERDHQGLPNCSEFKAMTPYARKDYVEKNRYCFFCLGQHGYKYCNRVPNCASCGSKKHHPLLCFNRSGAHHGQPNQRRLVERSPSRTGGGHIGSGTSQSHRGSPSRSGRKVSPPRTQPRSPHGAQQQRGNDQGERPARDGCDHRCQGAKDTARRHDQQYTTQ